MSTSYTMITGALGGLGSTFAYEYASQGTNLILVDISSEKASLLNYLSAHFPIEIKFYDCDLADHAARSELLKELETNGYQFNGLVNVVGQEIEGRFLARTRDEASYMLHLNIEAMVDLSMFVLNHHTPDQKFTLINVASLAGFFPIPHKAIYSSTKRFIIHFSLALREEIREFGNVTVLCPGGLPTNPEAMKKIFLQGFWGKMTAHDTHHVVKRTLNKAKRNIAVYTPGLANKFLVWLGRLLPAHWIAGYLSKRWQGKQSQLDYWRALKKTHKN